jgi:hypothetical protein
LYDASEGAGTRESTFNAIFNLRSPKHMREVFDAYQDIADGNSIEDLISSEFEGNLHTAYLTMGETDKKSISTLFSFQSPLRATAKKFKYMT